METVKIPIPAKLAKVKPDALIAYLSETHYAGKIEALVAARGKDPRGYEAYIREELPLFTPDNVDGARIFIDAAIAKFPAIFGFISRAGLPETDAQKNGAASFFSEHARSVILWAEVGTPAR